MRKNIEKGVQSQIATVAKLNKKAQTPGVPADMKNTLASQAREIDKLYAAEKKITQEKRTQLSIMERLKSLAGTKPASSLYAHTATSSGPQGLTASSIQAPNLQQPGGSGQTPWWQWNRQGGGGPSGSSFGGGRWFSNWRGGGNNQGGGGSGPTPPGQPPASDDSAAAPSTNMRAQAAMMAVQAAKAVAGRAWGAAMASSDAYSGWARGSRDLLGVATQDELFNLNNRGAAYGYSASETTSLALQAAQQTGSIESANMAQTMSRGGWGVDAGQFVGLQGTLTRGGVNVNSPENRRMMHMYATAMTQGIDRSRMGESLPQFVQIMESAQATQAGDVSGDMIAGMAGLLGRSGMSGFQGARGMSILQSVDEGIKNGGGGEEGKALWLQMLGFGTPNGTRSYMEAEAIRERGLSDPENVRAFIEEIKRLGGSANDTLILSMRDQFGKTIDQTRELAAIVEAGGTPEEILARVQAVSDQRTPEAAAAVSMAGPMGTLASTTERQAQRVIMEGSAFAQPMLDIQTQIYNLEAKSFEAIETGIHAVNETLKSTIGGGRLTDARLTNVANERESVGELSLRDAIASDARVEAIMSRQREGTMFDSVERAAELQQERQLMEDRQLGSADAAAVYRAGGPLMDGRQIPEALANAANFRQYMDSQRAAVNSDLSNMPMFATPEARAAQQAAQQEAVSSALRNNLPAGMTPTVAPSSVSISRSSGGVVQ